jgi:uncharacterized membrane protein YfhO
MLVIFIVEKITPFGPNSLTIIDSIHQYVPFFADYRDKLLNGGSLFYTWDVALGSNFMSLGAYYLSSPFNLLLLLFPKKYLVAGVCIIVSLKIALTGSTMAYYLTRSVKENTASVRGGSWYIIALSLAYALSNYVIGYYWNTMWMDCIMVFPLIMLGFKRLMDEKKPLLYCLTLFYALFCNYYIGFMICVFLVLWFFVYPHKSFLSFVLDGVRFAVASLCGGGMSAILLLPAYFGINATAAGEVSFPAWSLYYENFASIFKQQLALTEPITNMNFDGGVNLYCGVLTIFTLMLYLFHSFKESRTLVSEADDVEGEETVIHITSSEKNRTILLLAFIVVSFNATTLNFVWHGFHDQYGIPNRFSFLYIFVLVDIANKAITYFDSVKPVHTFIAMLISLIGVTVCYLFDIMEVSTLSVIVTLLLIFAYALIFLLRSCRYIKQRSFNLVIAAVLSVEMIFSGVYGFMQNGYADYDYYYHDYPNVQAAYDEAVARTTETDGFYRTELMDSTVLDEATWYNMRSVGTFCSTVLGDLVTTMGKLGFYTGANEFLYRGSTPLTNSLLNVRYLFKRSGDLDNYNFNYVGMVNDVEIYENPYPLSIGFAVNDNVKDWDSTGVERLAMQNSLAYDMTGISGLFTTVYPEITGYSETGEVSIDTNIITFSPLQDGAVSHTETFTVDSVGDYYVNCRGNYITKIRFYINGEEFAYDRYQIQIFHLGNLNTGDVVTVEYEYDSAPDEATTAALSVAKFDEQTYEYIYRALAAHKLTNVTYKDGYVKGNIDMPSASTLFTSIPYDEGWSVKVDGEECEYYEILGGFIGVDMETGQHTVEFTYTPKGFKLCAAISLFSLIIMIGFTILLCMTRKNED